MSKINEVTNQRKLRKDLKYRLTTLGLSVLLSGTIVSPAYGASINNPEILMNDKEIVYSTNVGAYLDTKTNITYIPLAQTLSEYGYSTYIDKGVIYSSCEKGSLVIEPGKLYFTFNNKKYDMRLPLVMDKNSVYVPSEVIATATQAKTEWNNETYRINYITKEKTVDEKRLDSINSKIDKNSNLTYQEKQTVKKYVKKYCDFIDPNLDEIDRITSIVSKLDIVTKYEGSNAPYYSVKNGIIYYNGSRSSKVSKDECLTNALTQMFNNTTLPLFNGVSEIVNAELNDKNTKQSLPMVNVSKILSDIIGSDKLLEAYKENDMEVIKKELMAIYKDEALYNNFVKLLNSIQNYDYAYMNGMTINKLSKEKMAKLYKEDVMNIYGIMDVYYQCKFGSQIIKDDVMEGYYQEMLCHGEKKSFKKERKVLVDNDDYYYEIYYEPQSNYGLSKSSYRYYDSSRPLNYTGNGQVLRLN